MFVDLYKKKWHLSLMNGMRLRHSQENFIKGCRNWITGTRFFRRIWWYSRCRSIYSLLAGIEMAKAGSGGVHISLMVYTIGAPPIQHFGSEELKARVLPCIISGEKISVLAITELAVVQMLLHYRLKLSEMGIIILFRARKHLLHREFVQTIIQLQCVLIRQKRVQKAFQCYSLMHIVKVLLKRL